MTIHDDKVVHRNTSCCRRIQSRVSRSLAGIGASFDAPLTDELNLAEDSFAFRH